MRKSYVPPVLIVLVGALGVAGYLVLRPDRTNTPEEVFRRSVEHQDAGDGEALWELLSPAHRERVEEGFREMVATLERTVDEKLREVQKLMVEEQFGLPISRIRTLPPKELFVARTRRPEQRQQAVLMEVVGDAEIDGDRASLPVRVGTERLEVEMKFVRHGGRWFIDDYLRNPRAPFAGAAFPR